MREITEHHDGHGLNESIVIKTTDPARELVSSRGDGIIAEHCQYKITIADKPVGEIQFQRGPRNEEGSVAGMTEGAVLAILIDRLQTFQASQFASRENAIALTHLEEALMWMRKRADNRAKRGVLGTTKL